MTRALRRWIVVVALGGTACTGIIDVPERPLGVSRDRSSTAIPRLSRREIEASLHDVLGIDGAALRNLPADPPAAVNPRTNGEEEVFDTLAATKEPNQVFVEGLENLAFEVARDFSEDHARVDALAGCTPSGTPDVPCLTRFVETLALRLWRRPAAAEETTALIALATPFATDPGAGTEGHYVSVRLAISALLQSPEFVYRTEIGTGTGTDLVRLDDHELISRLSYFLWGTTPTPELLAMAAGPELDENAIRALAESMVRDPRADAQMRTFHQLWLRYPSLLVTDAALAADMRAESDALLDRVLTSDATPWTDLFLSTETFVTPRLAMHYGLPEVPTAAAWVNYDGARAGILSHGSFLSLSSTRTTETLPSRRGAMLARRILCETILPPPPDIDVDTGVEVEPGACKSDAYEAHRNRGSCRGCHTIMDGLGFGLERFDGLGRYREVEEANPACPIDGMGSYDGAPFSGPRELAMLTEEAITSCSVEHLMRFAYRDRLASTDRARLRSLVTSFAGSGLDFRELMLAVALDPGFRHRVAGPLGELP